MKVEVTNLTNENLKDAPEYPGFPNSCKYCLYWESPEEFKTLAKQEKESIMNKKLAWLQRVGQEFGDCGKILYLDGKPVGYAQYAPPGLLPNATNYSVSPSDDAVLIACLFILYGYEKLGLGTMLLKNIMGDLRKRGFTAVETFARKNNSPNPSGPVEFYLKNGFRIYKDHEEFPLMRLDL